ncbi:MAG: aminotransferase class IV, partial [Firmicutes bacterium]|nr:aminotransferase class IV [Bacillota bacterium]
MTRAKMHLAENDACSPRGVSSDALAKRARQPPHRTAFSQGASADRTTVNRDNRGKLCQRTHDKQLNLLPNVLAKQKALDAGAQDAVFVRDNVVTECTSSNIALVSEGAIHTHPANDHILHGVTRRVMIELAKDMGMTVVEE